MANPSSYIKLDRNILRWKWYGDHTTLAVWIHLLLHANWDKGYFNGKIIQRGQYVFSLRKMSDELGLTVRSLRTALNRLAETGEITIEGFPRYTIATVVNYDKYQGQPERQSTQKPKRAKKQTHENLVPEMYREMFGEDFEAYQKWRKQ